MRPSSPTPAKLRAHPHLARLAIAVTLVCASFALFSDALGRPLWLKPALDLIPDRYIYVIDQRVGWGLLEVKYQRSGAAQLPTGQAVNDAAAAQLLDSGTLEPTATSASTPAIIDATSTAANLAPTATVTPVAPPPNALKDQAESKPADLTKATFMLTGFTQIIQTWNNCGPATISLVLSYWGQPVDQKDAQQFLKTDPEDRNVRPDELASYAQSTGMEALVRVNGSPDLLRRLIRAGFPVIVEKGFEPAGQRWQGHYLALAGYRDDNNSFIGMDSYLGLNREISAETLDSLWRHFNRTYLVVYPQEREQEVSAIIGADMDSATNFSGAANVARAELKQDANDAFGWFNLGSSLVGLGQYKDAAVAYDRARQENTLPFRMLWYQFGMYEAYYESGRYADVILMADATIEYGVPYLEESYYYEGLAYAAKGDKASARQYYELAVQYNGHFAAAKQALDKLGK